MNKAINIPQKGKKAVSSKAGVLHLAHLLVLVQDLLLDVNFRITIEPALFNRFASAYLLK